MTKTQNIPWKRFSIEAAAIVGSILLAFAIDAWWGDRQERLLGIDYLQRITRELHEIRERMEAQNRGVTNNIDAGIAALPFFDGDQKSVQREQLIVLLYNMGRDPPEIYDDSTYVDLISTGRLGLIRDVSKRQAIQSVYARSEGLQTTIQPNREEYRAGIRGWIPQYAIEQIRAACPNILADTWNCSNINLDIDEEILEGIIEQFSTDDALLAFRIRRQGLAEKRVAIRRALRAIDNTIALLN